MRLVHNVMATIWVVGAECSMMAGQVAAILDEICAQYDEVGLCPSPGTPGQSPKGQTPRHSSNSSGDGSGPQQQQQQQVSGLAARACVIIWIKCIVTLRTCAICARH